MVEDQQEQAGRRSTSYGKAGFGSLGMADRQRTETQGGEKQAEHSLAGIWPNINRSGLARGSLLLPGSMTGV